ncbi:uncharacterized protein FIESC28_08619 [Fusarium coffeatum]|uniref:Uncharacterized protein n=1 Tax=Fusarium coffeatum TaxID=231269 RepID=A0A366R8J7_9HYPO|nr:uncharacterized protein FIESC28_08619 [Fusarium coffeatum]RBR12495.1 hypothetical protein FIESC28_08619 [Fusarium coffeatum]
MEQLPEKHAAMADNDQSQGPGKIRQLREVAFPDYMLAPFALADALQTLFPEMSAAEFGINGVHKLQTLFPKANFPKSVARAHLMEGNVSKQVAVQDLKMYAPVIQYKSH